MSMLDFLYKSPDYDSDAARLADQTARTFLRYRTLDKVIDRVGDNLWEDSAAKRRRQSEELDLKLKRRALGLPMSDDDYEEATNEGRPFRTAGVVAAFGQHTSHLVPDPSFMPSRPPLPSAARDATRPVSAFLSTGEEISGAGGFLQRALGLTKGVSRYARYFGR